LSVDNSSRQLGITDKDFVSIEKSRRTNSILVVLTGALISVAAFIVGYMLGRESATDSYPFSSLSVMSSTVVRRRKVPWIAALIVAVVAFTSFCLGTLAANPPAFGVTTYYGVYGTKN